jgi:hypothetical protein
LTLHNGIAYNTDLAKIVQETPTTSLRVFAAFGRRAPTMSQVELERLQ